MAGGPAGPAARRLDESFVVLPGGPAAAQSALLDGAPGGSGGGSSASGSSVVQRIPFDAKLRALARVFEAASEATKVDFPLCAECAAEVHRELEAQLAELQQVGGGGRAADERGRQGLSRPEGLGRAHAHAALSCLGRHAIEPSRHPIHIPHTPLHTPAPAGGGCL